MNSSKTSFGPLVDAEWLAQHRDDPDLALIDVRWYPTGRAGREGYFEGHIPGAVYVDLVSEITGSAGPGRHPLPAPNQFQAAMRKAGISKTSLVVVYDDAGGSIASRLWFLLRLFGHEHVAVLDGGIGAWKGPLKQDAPVQAVGDFEVGAQSEEKVVDYERVSDLPGEWLLMDARAQERYRGEVEPIDPKAGHIPGAVNAPWSENLGPDGRFLSASELRKLYEERGANHAAEIVVQCGSGVTACHDLLALELAGFPNAKLYEGSWSDWCSRPDSPVATGDK